MWTTPRTWVAGELVTAALGNTHWRDQLALLKTSISDDGLTWTGAWAPSGGTVTVSTPVLNITQTWNAGAVTFTLIKANVTDTASAAASLLLDLQVGGVSKFKVQKDGSITVSGTSLTLDNAAPKIIFTGATAPEIWWNVAASARITANTSMYFSIDADNNATGDAFYWAHNASAGTVLMTLDDSGNLGLGGAPGSNNRLRVVGSPTSWFAQLINENATPNGVRIDYTAAAPNNTTNWFLYCADSATVRVELRSNGGLANYSANNVNLSDLGAKDITGPAPSQRAKIRALKFYRGRYKDSTRGHDDLMWGAQDILAIDPQWTDVWREEERDEAGTVIKPRLLGTRDHLIFMANVAATAELIGQVDDLAARVTSLERAA